MGTVCELCTAVEMKNEKYIQNSETDDSMTDDTITDNLEYSLVLELHNKLPAFDYNANAPHPDRVKRVYKSRTFLADDSVYDGEWNKYNLRDGRGISVWPNGDLYEGYWKNGKFNGKGRHIYFCGDVYEGDWVDHKRHGLGTYVYLDGTRREGGWLNDEFHGKGYEKWPNGTIFVGEFQNGKREGFGKFYYAKDGAVYEGQFKDDNMHGPGFYK